MKIFSPAKLDKIRREKYESFGDFFRALIIAAPEYGVKPAVNHIHNIMNGKFSPRAPYLALFARVLECPIDAFFVKKDPVKGK